jgi:predicted nucleotidyltransferase
MTALLDDVLETIRARRVDIEARHGVRLIGVAGSVARGQEKPGSDIDVLYDVTGRPTLFNLAEVQFELEEALGRRVDLVDREMMRPAARTYMERDLVLA